MFSSCSHISDLIALPSVPLFSIFGFWHQVIGGLSFWIGLVSALVVRELRGAFLTCVGSFVCDSGPFRLL